MTDTAAPAEALPLLRFRLPGDWWQVPLDSEEHARESIQALVRRQVGPADDLATLRRQFREQLTGVATSAIAGGGQAMHIARDLVEGVPFSASFTVILPAIRMTPAIGFASAEVLNVVEEGIRQTAPEELATATRFDTRGSGVLRVHRTVAARADDSPDDATDGGVTEPALAVDYWVTIPGTKRVVLLAFSTAFAGLAEVMLELFDSIVRAAYWESPPE